MGNVQPGYFNDDFEGSYDSQLTFLADRSSSYFIEASAFEADTGSYTLSVQSIGEIVDDYSNDVGTVSSISIGNSVLGAIELNGDIDWHMVNVEKGATYTIDLEGAQNGKGTLADPLIMGIYDEFGNSLEQSNDDGGEGANSRLEFTPDESGSYYIAATHYADTEPGTYTISISTVNTEKVDDFSADSYTSSPFIATAQLGEIEIVDTLTGMTRGSQVGTTIEMEGFSTNKGSLPDTKILGVQFGSGPGSTLNTSISLIIQGMVTTVKYF